MASLQVEEACKGDRFIDDFLIMHYKFGVKSNELRHVSTFSYPNADASEIKATLGCSNWIRREEFLKGPSYTPKDVLILVFKWQFWQSYQHRSLGEKRIILAHARGPLLEHKGGAAYGPLPFTQNACKVFRTSEIKRHEAFRHGHDRDQAFESPFFFMSCLTLSMFGLGPRNFPTKVEAIAIIL